MPARRDLTVCHICAYAHIRMKPLRTKTKRPGTISLGAADELDEVFVAVARHFGLLAEPTRLKILHAICREERPRRMSRATWRCCAAPAS